MDARRFDDLSRFLATAVPRQSVVRFLAGLGAAGFSALTGFEAAAKKRRHRKGQKNNKKRKRKKRRGGGVSAQAALCPGNQDKVCHCAPGSLGNCTVTGNGGGHDGDVLDCCCTIDGQPTPTCSCSGGSCCKPEGTLCSNTGQCCEGLSCCDIVAGIGSCQAEACCVPQTCADALPGQCGTLSPGCGLPDVECCGDDPNCCDSGQACNDSTCCTPLTCADNAGSCGPFSPGCGQPDIECDCEVGTCCDTICVDGSECCVAGDCPALLCQEVVDCINGVCEYTSVGNHQPGPLCDNAGQFCCNSDECCEAGQACTAQGCCTPLTCDDFPGQCGALDDGCGGEVNCGCGPEEGCCNGECLAGDQCCEDSDCAAVLCQVADCAAGSCAYASVPDDNPGPFCNDAGQTCCNGSECCAEGQACTAQGCCARQTCERDHFGVCGTFDDGCGGEITCCADNPACCEAGLACNGEQTCVVISGCEPLTQEEACAGSNVECGAVSDGCDGEYDCGDCPAGESCSAGACLAAGGQRKKRKKRKRCKGKGLAGQPCKGKRCKCKAGRRCHKGRCCETVGDGSRHCNANSDCCPGLQCHRREPDQHKVCVRKPVNAHDVTPAP